MKNKVLWSILGGPAMLSLVLAACAPAAPSPTATQTTAAPTTTSPTVPATTAPTTTAPAEKPKYGGTITYILAADTATFDQVYTTVSWARNVGQNLVNDRLLIGDWARGPAGTKELDFSIAGWAPQGVFAETGSVAESWEVPDDQTIIFHIRQGVHFQNKAPVNGRELDANDIAFSIKYMYLNPKVPSAYNVTSAPGGKKLLSATATDKWTVVVKVEDYAWAFFEDIAVKGTNIVAHEVVDQFGSLQDWRNAVGTGGFLLADYVPGSAFNFVRNPNYWMKNPVGPGKGDQLPYVDGVKVLIIKDDSTAKAAFRTGRIELLGTPAARDGYTLTFEDQQAIMKTNPKTQTKRIESASMEGIGVRLTNKDPIAVPLLNQRVRWALSMAIDREEMIRELYHGEAPLYINFFPTSSPYYSSPADMVDILEKVHGIKPEDAIMVKKAFEYHPDEAKKILAQEGYPNGFKAIVITPPENVDFLSVLKNYWQKNLNIDMSIDVRETQVYINAIDSHTFPSMFYYSIGSMTTNPAKFIHYGPGDPAKPFTVPNRWELSDPILDNYIQEVNAIYGKDLDKQNKLLKEVEAFIVWKAPWIAAPSPNKFVVWQPWLKNFYGSESVGFRGHTNFTYFAWLDQDLKKAMGH